MTTATDFTDEYYDDGEYEPPARAFCDNYVAHEPHTYTAINHQDYSCAGLTAAELAEIIEFEDHEGTCEHGLRENLCVGPMHYPDDRYDW